MNTELLHYRRWKGQFSRPVWSVWPIARMALRILFRRKLFWILYVIGLLIFLMFFFGGYLLDWALAQVPATPMQFGRIRTSPERLIAGLRNGIRILNGGQETFAYFYLYQGGMLMVILAMTGSILVGNDFIHGSLGFYLSKPLSRWHYILGKCLAIGIVVLMVTLFPALLLFAQHSLSDWQYLVDPDYFFRTGSGRGPAGVPLLLGIIGYGLLLAGTLSILLVAIASWVRRTMPLIMVWTTIFLFFRLLAAILVNGLRYDERWRLIDLWNNLRLVGVYLLAFEPGRVQPQPQPATWEAALVLILVCVLCLMYLNWRTRAVEVIK